MKHKIFYLVVALATLVFASCDSSEVDTTTKEKSTTYTISYTLDNSSLFDIYIALGASIKENIIISEYNDKNERVNIQDMENIQCGSKKTFTAHSLANKIALCYEVEMSYNGKTESSSQWVAQVIYLEKGTNINFTFNEETRVSSYCPVD